MVGKTGSDDVTAISNGGAAIGRRAARAAAVALAALLALATCVATASAAPLSMTFAEARANVGEQLHDDPLFAPPSVAPFQAQIDPVTGLISGGQLDVPAFQTHITAPIDADVTVDFDIGVVSGSFDRLTGALSLEGQAGGTLTSIGTPSGQEGQCRVWTEPGNLRVWTAGSSGGTNPRLGSPFGGGLSGAGAIAGTWADMKTEPLVPSDPDEVTFCNNVYNQIGGEGGVWLRQDDIVPPAAPQLTGTDPGSPNASGSPRIRGSAEAGSTVRLYAGPGCAGSPLATVSAAQLGSPGIAVEVAEGATATFSATATDAAANASACSAPISYTRLKPTPPPPPPPACKVPKLIGKKLGRATKLLKAAHCERGTVHRPRPHKGKHGLKAKRRGPFVVRSSSPRAGARPADGTVDLWLGPKPRKHATRRGHSRR